MTCSFFWEHMSDIISEETLAFGRTITFANYQLLGFAFEEVQVSQQSTHSYTHYSAITYTLCPSLVPTVKLCILFLFRWLRSLMFECWAAFSRSKEY